jgi:hypothetical protein
MIVIRSFLAPLEVHKTSHALVSVPTPRMKHPLPQSNVALLTSILNKANHIGHAHRPATHPFTV